jgi:hypothetical protein
LLGLTNNTIFRIDHETGEETTLAPAPHAMQRLDTLASAPDGDLAVHVENFYGGHVPGIYALGAGDTALDLVRTDSGPVNDVAITLDGDTIGIESLFSGYGGGTTELRIFRLDEVTGEQTLFENTFSGSGPALEEVAVSRSDQVYVYGKPSHFSPRGIYALNSGQLFLLRAGELADIAVSEDGDLIGVESQYFGFTTPDVRIFELSGGIETQIYHAQGPNVFLQDIDVADDGTLVITGRPSQAAAAGVHVLRQGDLELVRAGVPNDIAFARRPAVALPQNLLALTNSTIFRIDDETGEETILAPAPHSLQRLDALASASDGDLAVHVENFYGGHMAGIYALDTGAAGLELARTDDIRGPVNDIAIASDDDTIAIETLGYAGGTELRIFRLDELTGEQTLFHSALGGTGPILEELALGPNDEVFVYGQPDHMRPKGVYHLSSGNLNLIRAGELADIAVSDDGELIGIQSPYFGFSTPDVRIFEFSGGVETELYHQQGANLFLQDVDIADDGTLVVTGRPEPGAVAGIHLLRQGSWELVRAGVPNDIAFSRTEIQTIDNGEPGFFTSGNWALGGGPDIGRMNDVMVAIEQPNVTDIANWQFPISAPGRYRVSATWYVNPSFSYLYADPATFGVFDADSGVARGTALVNQRQVPNDFDDAGSAWENLGEFDITGDSLLVRLYSAGGNGYVVADAIRIERVDGLSTAGEIQVTMAGPLGTGADVADGTGNAGFGTTVFNQPVERTFTISNSGTQPISLVGPVSVTGSTFVMIAQPGLTTLGPGQFTTFAVRMNGTQPGFQSATVSFGNTDGNESPFEFTVSGTVLSTRIIDDGDPGFQMSPLPGAPGGWGQIGGPGREFDYKFNRNIAGVDEFATWTFSVTPGVYRVSTTWAFGFAGFDDAAPFTIFDGTVAGGVVRGGRNVNQKLDPSGGDYPPGFMFPLGTAGSTSWERIDVVNITGNTLTVLLQADDPVEFVLADSILIDRLGDIPPGPEIVVVTGNRNASGTVNFGTTPLNHPVDKTFTITNSGNSALNITSPINITGPNAAAFQLVSGPSSTAIAPGGTSTFVVRLRGAYDGPKNATISFNTNDANEGVVSIAVTGNVLPYRIIDDQNVADGFTSVGMISEPNSPISYRGDVSFASSSLVQPPASATWTFNNMSPGLYYVALTWFDTSGNPAPYSGNTPVTVSDGAVVEGTFSVNQKVGPASFAFDGVAWLIVGFFDFSSPTVTVTMTNFNTNGVILADGVLINRIGGTVPPGNGNSGFRGEAEDGQQPGPPVVKNALEAAFTSGAYWVEDSDEVAIALSGTAAASDSPLPDDLAAEELPDRTDELDQAIDQWLNE